MLVRQNSIRNAPPEPLISSLAKIMGMPKLTLFERHTIESGRRSGKSA
jgi:hypothetical protein